MPTVSSCHEVFGSRDFDVSLNEQGRQVTRHTRTFQVILNSGGSGADAAAAGAVLAQAPLRSEHPEAPLARAKSLRGRSESDDDKKWFVDVEYDTDTPSQDEHDQEHPDNPLDEPWEVDFDFEQFGKPLDRDADGNAVTNSADEPFDPAPEVDDGRLVLRITRNEAEYPTATALAYKNKVNSDTFYGAPAGYVKAKPIRGTRQTKRLQDGQLLSYYRVSYEFHFRGSDEEDWDAHLLDQGYRELVDMGGAIGQVYLNITDRDDMPLNQPTLLDGAGAKLPHGGTPVFRDFKAYKRLAFSALNVGGS